MAAPPYLGVYVIKMRMAEVEFELEYLRDTKLRRSALHIINKKTLLPLMERSPFAKKQDIQRDCQKSDNT